MTVVWGLLGLCVIVVVHEFGHFIAAKLTGITAETFSVGMGPVLLRKKIKETEFRLSLLPIGGYCGLKGEDSFQKALESGLSKIPKEPGSFYENPVKRFFIAVCGPLFNVFFAIVAFTVISFIGDTYQSTSTKIILATELYPEMTSAAEKAGIQSGDEITALNNKPVSNFSDLYTFISIHPDELVNIEVLRNGTKLVIPVKTEMDKESASGKIGVINWVEPVAASVAVNSPAYKAGLQKNDLITCVDNIPIRNTAELQKQIENKTSFTLSVLRDETIYNLDVEMEKSKDNAYYLGISFPSFSVTVQERNPILAIRNGFVETGKMIALTLKTITWFFKGIDFKNAVSGPVRITVMLGEAAEAGFSAGIAQGFITVLKFLSLISISLFIMNLLPIPVLDGGIALFAFLEAVFKINVSPKFLSRFQIVGFALISVLFVFALSNDINYLFIHK